VKWERKGTGVPESARRVPEKVPECARVIFTVAWVVPQFES